VGALAKIGPLGVTFAAGWLLLMGALATVVVLPVIARDEVPPSAVRAAMRLYLVAAVAAAVLAMAFAAAAVIVWAALPAAPAGPPANPADLAARAAMIASLKRNLAFGSLLGALFSVLALRSAMHGRRAQRSLPRESPAQSTRPGGQPDVRGAASAGLAWTAMVLVAIQPFRFPTNNPVATEAAVWDSPETEELVKRACADCHSNESRWPWYTRVAPSNWLTVGHVRSGRRALNLSELDKLNRQKRSSLGERMGQSVERGFMPPVDYKRAHRPAQMSEAEKTALVDGFHRSLGGSQ
jgi:hypothetical protein